MEKLKPCPFCGANKAEIENDGDGDGMHDNDFKFWVRCAKCGAHSSEELTPKAAAMIWNFVANACQKWLVVTEIIEKED